MSRELFQESFVRNGGGARRSVATIASAGAQLMIGGGVILASLVSPDILTIRQPTAGLELSSLPVQSPSPVPPVAQLNVSRPVRPFQLTFPQHKTSPAEVAPPDAFESAREMGIGGSGPIGLPRDFVGLGSELASAGRPTPTAPPKPLAPPPPPADPAPSRVRVHSTIQAAKLIRQVKPAYPEIARRARIQGVVVLEAIIAKDGSIQKLVATQGHPLLVGAALEAVRQWLYEPTLLNEIPVEVQTIIEVHFRMGE